MTLLLAVPLALVWWSVGAWSFVHWWTTEYDLKSSEIAAVVIIGFIGPLAYPAGWSIHSRKSRVLVKKKEPHA